MSRKDKIGTVIFNIAEIVVVFLMGVVLGISNLVIIYIMLVWMFTRLSIGQAKHYKQWQKCFILTTLVFLSLFINVFVGLVIATILTVFTVYLLSGRADIEHKDKTKPYINYRGEQG